jgi:hypothetical protein
MWFCLHVSPKIMFQCAAADDRTHLSISEDTILMLTVALGGDREEVLGGGRPCVCRCVSRRSPRRVR